MDSHSNESTVLPVYRTKRALCQLQPWNIPTAMLILPCHAIENACNAVPLQNTAHSPCLIRSASCLFPKSHMFIRPCSERSMFFIEVMSCAGGLLTREATMTGSVSRMMPSSTSSSTASDWECQRKARGCSESWLAYHQVVVLDDGALVDRVPAWCVSIELLGVSRCTDFRRMLSESRSARTTLRRVSWSFFRVMASSHTCTAAPRSPRRYPRRRA